MDPIKKRDHDLKMVAIVVGLTAILILLIVGALIWVAIENLPRTTYLETPLPWAPNCKYLTTQKGWTDAIATIRPQADAKVIRLDFDDNVVLLEATGWEITSEDGTEISPAPQVIGKGKYLFTPTSTNPGPIRFQPLEIRGFVSYQMETGR